MQLAYLMNSYPITSTTFIRREINALERLGLPVKRYAVRHWDGELVEAADREEQAKIHYLLTNNITGLLGAFFLECLTNPARMAKTLRLWASLLKTARGGIVRHVAYLLQAAYFKRRALKDGVAHVHAHFGTNATAVAMLSKSLGGPSYSFTVHGPDELFDAPQLSYPAKIENAAFVAAISHFCKSQLIRLTSHKSAEKIKIIHCGVSLEDFLASPLPNNKTFVCVGRLCPQKGQSLMPRAIAELAPDYPDLKVVFIGDGESRQELEEEIARLDIGAHVELRGWQDGAGVHKAISEGRIFLLPTFAEGLPVVLMEAYALGRPAISTFIAGIPELVDHESGWILPAGDHEALVVAMRAALNATDAELSAKAQIGHDRVAAKHDIEKEAAALSRLFRRHMNA